MDNIDSLIKSGNIAAAQKELNQFRSRKILRQNLAEFCALARRAHMCDVVLKLLHPIVRPTGKITENPTVFEKAEYSAALTYVGATEEALEILKSISPKEAPQSLLFQCFAYFAQWEYKKSIPLLNQYLSSTTLDSYQRSVGQINLASAYIYEREHEKAHEILVVLLNTLPHSTLLYRNSLELTSANFIYQQNFEKAHQMLQRANDPSFDSTGLSHFFVKKWEAILSFIEKPRANISKLHAIREKALSLHWETARDCDRFEALHTKNLPLFLYLYFGTPYESFRSRLKLDFGITHVPDEYIWYAQDPFHPKKNMRVLDLMDALKLGQLTHKTLSILTRDFYRPIKIGVAHHLLYPNEYFNPLSSSHKIHEAMRRLGVWFGKKKLPLKIDEKEGFYRLISKGSIGIKIHLQPFMDNKLDLNLQKLKTHFSSNMFSAIEASKILRISKRSAQRLLQKAVETESISRQSQGSKTFYQLVLKKAA